MFFNIIIIIQIINRTTITASIYTVDGVKVADLSDDMISEDSILISG